MPNDAPPIEGTMVRLPIEKLQVAEYNPRRITPEARAKLKASIEEFGMVDPIIVNGRQNQGPAQGYVVVGGHQRLSVCKELGMAEVPCVVLSLTLEQEQMLNVALNNQSMAGTYDTQKLGQLVLDWSGKGLELQATGFSQMELDRFAERAGAAPELQPGGAAGAGPGADESVQAADPAQMVRMVQLYLNNASFPPFMAQVQKLGRLYGTANTTDTILKCVERLCQLEPGAQQVGQL